MTFPVFLHLVLLAGFLLGAVWWDLKFRRIPNFLVLSGAIFGLSWSFFMPGTLGVGSSLLGMMLGLMALLPLYLMRAMGAGDVKLMAMVGAFLGPADVLGAVLGTFVVGGVLAVAYSLRAGSLRRLADNLRFMLLDSIGRLYAQKAPQFGDLPDSAGRMPYALAIALGTLGYLGWRYGVLAYS